MSSDDGMGEEKSSAGDVGDSNDDPAETTLDSGDSAAEATAEPPQSAAEEAPEPPKPEPAVAAPTQSELPEQVAAVIGDTPPSSNAMMEEPDLPPPQSVPPPRAVPSPRVLPPAELTDLSPTKGPTTGGTKLTLVGKNLQRESIVRIGGVIATTIGALQGRELHVETPPREFAGQVDVSIQNPGAELTVVAKAFRYEPLPAPEIESVAPNRGAVDGGTEIAINGHNFVASSKILIDGRAVGEVKFVDSTVLETKTPAGKAGKMIDVVVENPDGNKAVAKRCFMYDERY